MTVPKCEECKWFVPKADTESGKYVLCDRTAAVWDSAYCQTTESERFPGWLMARLTGRCGKEGRFYERN